MSEITNEAVIKVTADASGVEAGLRRVDEAAAKTGKNLDNLEASAKKTTSALEGAARTPGLEAAGDGAGVAAGRMDRATKSMADSIQRTMAQMNAGAKGSAQYYEALANARGLDVNALRPFLNQLDEMTRKSALAADAQRKLDESTKFLDSLRSRTEGIGKSASELAALRAQQLGVSDAAAEMIEKLREQEQAGESSFGGLGEMAGRAKIALLAVATSVAAAAAAGLALINGALDGLAELDDLAQKTGSSVESLSKIQNLAAVFGADMGAIDGALSKVSKGMTAFDDDSSKVQKALKALGVSSKDAAGNLRDPSVVLVDAAKSLQGYSDGASKAALLTDLLGKSGPDLLPFLNDLAENYDEVAGTTSAAAGAAAGFQDQIGWAKLEFKEFVKEVTVSALPALIDLAGAFADVYKEQSAIQKQEWKAWADGLGLGIAKAADMATVLARAVGIIWNSVKAVRADIGVVTTTLSTSPLEVVLDGLKGKDGLAGIKKAIADRDKIVTEANARLQDLFNRPTGQYEAAFLKRLNGREQGGEAAPAAGTPKPRLRYTTGSDGAAKEAKKALEEYEALLNRINSKTAELDPDYQKNVAMLAAGYKAGKLSLAEYNATLEKYNSMQPYALRAAKAVSDFQAEYAKGLDATSAVYAKRLQDAEDEAARNQDLARTYGMTKSSIEQLELARLEEQLAQRNTLGLTLDEIDHLEKLIDAKKRNAAAVAAMEQVDAAKKAAEEWKRAAESIEQSLTDALLRGFESGKDFGQNLVDTLKNMFGTLVLRPVISAVVNPVAASLTNALGLGGAAVGAAGASGGAASIGSLVGAGSSLSNLYGMVTGGTTLAGGLGTGFLGSLAGGLNGAGIGSGLTSALGMNIGNGIASVVGPNVASGIATGLSGLAAAAPWVAGALAVYTIGKKAFGRGPKEYTGDQTLNGSLGAGGFTGTLDAEWVKKGGWFRSDKKGTDRNPVETEFAAGLTSAYDAIKASSSAAARVLGINADSIATRAQAIKIALGKDEESNQKLIAEFFTGVANTVAGELLPEIDKFQAQGEAASATLERLAVNFTAVDQILLAMGTTSLTAFRAVGTESIEARERLLALAGGIDALATQTTFFNDNFLSEAERVAIIQKPLQEGLASLGFASLTTADQYKEAVQQLVSSGALATEQGAKQYAGLLALGPQFKTVSDYLKSVGDAAAETARQAAEAAAKAQEAAVEAAKQAAEAARQAALDQASAVLGGVDSSFSVLQRVVDRQKKALQEDIQMRSEAVGKLKSMSDALRSTLDGMRTPEQQEADRASAQAEIRAALAIARAGGPLPDSDKLQRALAAIGNGPSTDGYATLLDYQRDLFGTQGDLAELAKLTDGALTVEERSLKTLEDQVKQYDLQLERQQELIDIAKGQSITGLSIEQALFGIQASLAAANANPVVSATAAITDAYKTSLGRAPDAAGLDYWKGQAANGISTGAITDSIAASSEAKIRQLYKDVFGRPADAGGLNYWIDRFEAGVSLDSIRQTFETSDEKKKLRGFAVGTNRVPYDMPAMIHEDERIIPAADNRELMRRLASPSETNVVLAAAVERLERQLAGMRSEMFEVMYQTAKNTGRSANSLEHMDRVGIELNQGATA